jgi:hypothetical protein
VPRNLVWFQFLVKMPIRLFVLPAFAPPGEPSVHLDGFAQAVGNRLCTAILSKLGKWYRNDAARGADVLIRYHWRETIGFINQGHAHLKMLLLEDMATTTADFVGRRLQRLLPELEALPDFTGKSNTRAGHGLTALVLYDGEYNALREILPRRRSTKAGHNSKLAPLDLLRARYHGERWASAGRLKRWSGLSPSQVALEVVCHRMSAQGHRYTPSQLRHYYFPKATPRVEAFADTFEAQQNLQP